MCWSNCGCIHAHNSKMLAKNHRTCHSSIALCGPRTATFHVKRRPQPSALPRRSASHKTSSGLIPYQLNRIHRTGWWTKHVHVDTYWSRGAQKMFRNWTSPWDDVRAVTSSGLRVEEHERRKFWFSALEHEKIRILREDFGRKTALMNPDCSVFYKFLRDISCCRVCVQSSPTNVYCSFSFSSSSFYCSFSFSGFSHNFLRKSYP